MYRFAHATAIAAASLALLAPQISQAAPLPTTTVVNAATGQRVQVRQRRDRATQVVFWSVRSFTSRRLLTRLARDSRRGVDIIAVNLDPVTNDPAVRRVARRFAKHGILVVSDRERRIARALNPRQVTPLTVLLRAGHPPVVRRAPTVADFAAIARELRLAAKQPAVRVARVSWLK